MNAHSEQSPTRQGDYHEFVAIELMVTSANPSEHAINVKKAIPIHNDAKEGINEIVELHYR